MKNISTQGIKAHKIALFMSEYFSTSGTKLSAEMQEAILAATPNMMVIFDDSYHLVGLHNPILEHIPYPPEEMVGKKVMVLVNLKPAKLAGVLSEGMLLCAEDAEGNLALMTPEKVMPSGAEIC